MRGTEILESTMHMDEIHRLTESSEKLMDEILDLMANIDEPEDSMRQVWLTAPRGTLQEYINGDHRYDDITTEEKLLRAYPDDPIWIPLSGLRYRGTKYLRINELSIRIDARERDDLREFDYDCDELFLWAKNALIGVLEEIRKGTYNDYVRRALPYTLRNGTIKRSIYWKVHPEDMGNWLEGLTKEEIAEFVDTAQKYKNEPARVIKGMTFHKYMDMAIACYKRIGYDIYDDYVKTFFCYAEDYGSRVLENDVDYESEQNFDDFFDDKCGNMGGHPWGIIRGSSRTRIMLYPERKDGGYYFRLGGNPNWNVKDLVRSFFALRDLGVPFLLSNPTETIRYLKNEDLIGIVSSLHTPIYCQLLFPNKNVNDFRNLDLEEDQQLLEKINWEPIEEVRLKQ